MRRHWIIGLAVAAAVPVLVASAAAPPGPAAEGDAKPGPTKTQVVAAGGGWVLVRDGKPFFIMGAGGGAPKDKLAQAGANSYRTWGPPDLKELDAAHKLGLAVTVGIGLGTDGGFNYANSAAVARQLDNCKKTFERLKDHPAVLAWGIGNEMEGAANKGDNPYLWKAIDDIAAAAKQIDPNHPTMTVVAEIGGVKVKAIHLLCPHIDIVGINSYGGVQTIGARYRSAGGMKPYVVTEFGPPGVWELHSAASTTLYGGVTPRTAAAVPDVWNPVREWTSTDKVKYYREGWRMGIAANRGLCLGGYAFTWGAKWEATATWYGMFLADGAKLECVDALTEQWSGKAPANYCPRITGLRLITNHPNLPLDKQGLVNPGEKIAAVVTAVDPEKDPLTVKWALHGDVDNPNTGGAAIPPTKAFPDAIKKSDGGAVEIEMPQTPGSYRLYVYVYDDKGGAATGNFPLHINKP